MATLPAPASVPPTPPAALRWITVIGFVVALWAGGVLFWLTPREGVSVNEKRQLARPATLTAKSVFDGSYERGTEAFYNDNFPGRDRWIDAAGKLKSLRGFAGNDIQVITRPDTPDEGLNAQPQNSAAADFTPADEDFRKVRAVVVVNGRAVQIFGGTKNTIAPFVAMVDRYHEVLGPGVRIYVMSIPAGSDFYLPRQVNDGVLKEKANIDLLYAMLDPGIVPVRAYDEIAPHTKEYIQFRTDHHWTGLGAYYAYRAFARAAGWHPLELAQMEHRQTKGPFVGSLYDYTRSPEVLANPDTVDYWKVPGAAAVKATVFRHGSTDGVPGFLYYDNAHGGNSYGVFIGGDQPLIRFVTGRHTGRKILIVKDSFGNAFAPYLAAHYDEVWVADYRYFKGSLPALMRRERIGELIFALNSFVTNSRATIKFGNAMLDAGGDGTDTGGGVSGGGHTGGGHTGGGHTGGGRGDDAD